MIIPEYLGVIKLFRRYCLGTYRWYNERMRSAKITFIFRWVSYILSPPLVFAVLGFGVALVEAPGWRGLWLGVVYGFFVSLLPLAVPVYLVRSGRAADIHMSDQRLRRVPYLVSTLSSAFAWMLLRIAGAPAELNALAFVSVVGLGSLGVLNQVSLVSSHAAAITMAAAFTGIVYGWQIGVWIVPLVVVVFVARWYLGRHTPAELLSGLVTGVFVALFTVIIGIT